MVPDNDTPPSESYTDLLEEIQRNQVKIFNSESKQDHPPQSKEYLMEAMKNYLTENSLNIQGYSLNELAEKLYNDLVEDSVLTEPLKDIWVEKINIYSWNHVTVSFINGKSVQIADFNSPQHASDVVKRLIKKEGLDDGKSKTAGKMRNGNRFAAIFPPYIRDELGVYCTIRKRRQRNFSAQIYVSDNFAAQRELDFLSASVRHGLSLLIVGAPDSGKTAFLEYLLSTMPEKNTVVLEQGDREINTGQSILIANEDSVSDNIRQILYLGPDAVGFNLDSCIAQEVGLQGIPVIAVVNSDTPYDGLHLASEQWRSYKTSLDAGTALELTGEIFQLIVTLHRYADHKRRIADITECSIDGSRIMLKTVWAYEIQTVQDGDTGPAIRGVHKKAAGCSEALIRRIRQNGIDPDKVNLFEMEDSDYAGRESNWPAGSGSAVARDPEE